MYLFAAIYSYFRIIAFLSYVSFLKVSVIRFPVITYFFKDCFQKYMLSNIYRQYLFYSL